MPHFLHLGGGTTGMKGGFKVSGRDEEEPRVRRSAENFEGSHHATEMRGSR